MTYNRENFPLEVGEQIEIDGRQHTLVDIPTDGPLFRDEEEENEEYQMVQLTYQDFAEVFEE